MVLFVCLLLVGIRVLCVFVCRCRLFFVVLSSSWNARGNQRGGSSCFSFPGSAGALHSRKAVDIVLGAQVRGEVV